VVSNRDILILGAEVDGQAPVDVRVRGGRINRIARDTQPGDGDTVIEANGGALLPGLHDHHIHLLAVAASRHSVWCGPPSVRDRGSLAAALRRAAAAVKPDGWLRGIGYHESVAGPLDRALLDAIVADRPVRVQHRSGQLWVFNTMGSRQTGLPDANGQLWHGDARLRTRGDLDLVDLAPVGELLAGYGVTGVTDATVTNGPEEATFLRHGLPQSVMVMGDDRLDAGPRKVVLHDDRLPSLPEMTQVIADSHRRGRVVAVHSVTRGSLLYSLAAFEEAGAEPGDRIEHGSVIPNEAVPSLARLGLTVVTQPNFVTERGDDYLRDVDVEDRPLLYRLNSLLDRGVAVAAGTDASFGHPDPWRAISAAVCRRTADGAVLGPEERITPERALALFLGDGPEPTRPRAVGVGAPADLCLLTSPWREARERLTSDLVHATIAGGQLIYQR
jgi:predicted amidohydrolase YtcJ